MNKYEICDRSSPLLEAMPIIEAKSPKEAVEKYSGKKCVRVINSNTAELLAATTTWPLKMYLYNTVSK